MQNPTLYRVSFDWDGSADGRGRLGLLLTILSRRASVSKLHVDRFGPGGGNPNVAFETDLSTVLFVASIYCNTVTDVIDFLNLNVELAP
jgi:hypothetical protein